MDGEESQRIVHHGEKFVGATHATSEGLKKNW